MKGKYFKLQNNSNGVGYWEYKDGTEGGILEVENGEVVDFDGDFDLPQYVKDDLSAHGIDCDF